MAHHQYVEAKGRKRPRLKKELHHIEIHAHEDGTPENPRWLVLHDFGPEHEMQGHEFDDHEAMLDHLRQHSGVEPMDQEEEG